ncbi:hypothetical protein ACM66B_003952 [Microbotryomycetes sp. NB124-2]
MAEYERGVRNLDQLDQMVDEAVGNLEGHIARGTAQGRPGHEYLDFWATPVLGVVVGRDGRAGVRQEVIRAVETFGGNFSTTFQIDDGSGQRTTVNLFASAENVGLIDEIVVGSIFFSFDPMDARVHAAVGDGEQRALLVMQQWVIGRRQWAIWAPETELNSEVTANRMMDEVPGLDEDRQLLGRVLVASHHLQRYWGGDVRQRGRRAD